MIKVNDTHTINTSLYKTRTHTHKSICNLQILTCGNREVCAYLNTRMCACDMHNSAALGANRRFNAKSVLEKWNFTMWTAMIAIDNGCNIQLHSICVRFIYNLYHIFKEWVWVPGFFFRLLHKILKTGSKMTKTKQTNKQTSSVFNEEKKKTVCAAHITWVV